MQAALAPTQNVAAGTIPIWSTRNNASDRPASAVASAPLKSWPLRVLASPDNVRARTAMLRNVRTMITETMTMMLPRSSRDCPL